MIITKESHNSIIRSIKKVCNIVFGSIPPKKICPNLWRSIVYAVIMLGLMYWYGINNNKLVNNFVSFLLVIISIIIGIMMVFSYFFLAEKIENIIRKYWYEAKWRYLYPNIEDWLTVTNLERNKIYWVLKTLNKREELKYTNSEYRKIKSENKVNGFLLYECLVRDFSNLNKEKLVTIKSYTADTKNNIDAYHNSVNKLFASLPLFIIFLIGFLGEEKLKIHPSKNIEEDVDVRNILRILLNVWNQGFICQYFIITGLLTMIFVLLVQFLSNRREIRTKALLVSALNEALNKKYKID